MDQIQSQASKLLELLFSDETAATYQKTLNLTGTLLKETAQLIWLIICSAFVFGAWVSDTSVKLGSSLRNWIDQQSSPSLAPAEKKPLSATGKSLLDQGKTAADYLLNQAREQLGLEPVTPTPGVKAVPAKSSMTEPAATQSFPTPQASPQTSSAEPAASEPAASESAAPEPKPSASAPTLDSSISKQLSARPVPNEDVSHEPDDGGWPPQAVED
ncbi:MAG: hypothetical protein WA783_10285 [Phormidesmis sp.]